MKEHDSKQYIHFWLWQGQCFIHEGPIANGMKEALEHYSEYAGRYTYSHTIALDDQGYYREINLEDMIEEQEAEEEREYQEEVEHRRFESRKSKFI